MSSLVLGMTMTSLGFLKIKLDKNQKISVQIALQQGNFCLTFSFTVTVLFSFACEYCHPANSLPTNVILTKLSS